MDIISAESKMWGAPQPCRELVSLKNKHTHMTLDLGSLILDPESRIKDPEGEIQDPGSSILDTGITRSMIEVGTFFQGTSTGILNFYLT